MTTHVAILLPRYIDLMLRGEKTMESRLTRRPIAPFDAIKAGDVIHFKASGGRYRAVAKAARVHCFKPNTPAEVEWLAQRFNGEVCAEPAYWDGKRHSRFATFIALCDVRPADTGPALAPSRGPAWFVLGDATTHADIATSFEVTLTEGAIRNGYVRIPTTLHRFPADAYAHAGMPGRPIALELPDGRSVETDMVRNTMFRWRGWTKLFAITKVRCGDRVRFETCDARRYRVSIKTIDR